MNLEESIQKNKENLTMNKLSLQTSEGVVTDQLVVQKALFYMLDDTTVYVSIDIRPQPIYNSKFLGAGEFDLSDRELRSSLEEICEEVIDSSGFIIDSLSFDKQIRIDEIYITANNYEVGKYNNGSVKLTGE
ncbi:MAG: hypothetical protein H0S78_03885 [Tissierellales bacterium]|nr:hypothetical protein [Tissierellales bacterium]